MASTFADILDFLYKVLSRRGEVFREEIRVAANFALQDIGTQFNWEFLQDTIPITTTSGSNTSTVPNIRTVRNITAVYGSDGQLTYYPIKEFRRRYAGNTTTGTPTTYSFWKDGLIWYPTPSSAISFTCDAIRKIGGVFETLLNEDGAPLLIAATLHYLDPKDSALYKKYERLLQVTLKNIPKVKDRTQYIQQDERREKTNDYISGLY